MSGLEDLLKGRGGLAGLLARLLGRGGSGGTMQALLPIVTSLLAGGGLNAILSKLRNGGLKSQADSWLGTGPNEPVTGGQLREALGADEIGEIATRLGLSHDDAADALARLLPQVVDRVTPDGTLPPDSEIESALQGLARQLERV